jgi:hypothetical protein
MRHQARSVDHRTYSLKHGGAERDSVGEKHRAALVRARQADEHPDCGRLASTVGAEQPADLAPRYGESDVTYSTVTAVALAQADRADRRTVSSGF